MHGHMYAQRSDRDWGVLSLLAAAFKLCTCLFLLPKQKLDMPRKRESQWKNFLHQIGPWAWLWDIFLMNAWCRKAKPTVGGVIPRQMSLGYEYEALGKPIIIVPPWSLISSCHPVPALAPTLISLNDALSPVRWNKACFWTRYLLE